MPVADQQFADQIQRFVLDDTPIRGQLISLDDSWRTMRKQSEPQGFAQTLFAQALTATALLASTLKIDGKITLQIRGDGPLPLLVAEATSQNTLRGLIRQHADIEAGQPLTKIFGSERLIITIDSGKGKPHQGIVPLQGDDLSIALQTYFDHSEQLPTRFWFASDDNHARGMLLQRMPGETHDEDAWERAIQLASTIENDELLSLEPAALLHRLYHQEKTRVFEAEDLGFACSCSRERTANMLLTLGADELNSILAEQDAIEINCEFCNQDYRFDAVDVGQLLHAGKQAPASSTTH